jgi:hypothetical protein
MMERFPSASDIHAHRAGVPLSPELSDTPLTSVEEVVDRLMEQIRLAFHSGKQRISTSVSFTPGLTSGLPAAPTVQGSEAEFCNFRTRIREFFDVYLRQRVNYDVIDGDIRLAYLPLIANRPWLLEAEIEVLVR